VSSNWNVCPGLQPKRAPTNRWLPQDFCDVAHSEDTYDPFRLLFEACKHRRAQVERTKCDRHPKARNVLTDDDRLARILEAKSNCRAVERTKLERFARKLCRTGSQRTVAQGRPEHQQLIWVKHHAVRKFQPIYAGLQHAGMNRVISNWWYRPRVT
jgi:hypothetical protein